MRGEKIGRPEDGKSERPKVRNRASNPKKTFLTGEKHV